MRVPRRQRLPLAPLLHAYLAHGISRVEELGKLPGLGPRFQAILAARTEFFNEAFLDTARESALQTALAGFYEKCVPLPLHADTLRRRCAIVRHGMAHLLRGADLLPQKVERCLASDGPYHVNGLGPVFWSALVQALDPSQQAAWTPSVVSGLARLGLASWRTHDRPARVYAALQEAYAQIRERAPALSALHIDHFLSLVAAMRGRDLWSGKDRLATILPDLPELLRQERSRLPLRRRLKERGQFHQHARRELERGLATQDGPRIGAALTLADPDSTRRTPLDWQGQAAALALWVGRLWEADDPYEILENFWRSDPLPGAGLWLPAAVLHLRDACSFQIWNETARQGYAALDDSLPFVDSAGERYRLFNEGVVCLCSRFGLHPLEVPTLWARLSEDQENPARSRRAETLHFSGFCNDTFRFLADLGANNCRAWMEQQRERYRFVVREPLIELCQALAKAYIEPVLHRERGWQLETAARTGRSLTSICKNDYGRTVPYHTSLWITFFRSTGAGNIDDGAANESQPGRDSVQFFVRLDAAGLRYGLRLIPLTGEAASRFRHHIAACGEPLYRLLAENGVTTECRFSGVDDTDDGIALTSPEDLQRWAGGKSLMVFKAVPAGSSLATASELAGDILLTFDRLLPLYACAVEPDPQAWLTRCFGCRAEPDGFTPADFCRSTYLDLDWFRRARELLDLKRQIILQGVPGTGKTHVARALALALAGGRQDAVRLVQFHPAYSYEEFVEGIRVRSVEVNGRQDVTYPVEDGLLCAFAAEAASRPEQAHVLIIDEINRGNLPRIFGELLYLLEYRGEIVRLLYSKREFRLPPNLYLIGTMNAADRSVALIDQALRRRFSFLDMPPDAGVLAAWLEQHLPAAGIAFTGSIVALFDRLNTHLRRDLGPQYQIGHSYFMVPNLDASRLRVVWVHHVLPLLKEYFHGHPEQIAAYELDRLLSDGRRRSGKRPHEVHV
jgi:5-methylcytosine-specific restriction protein B